MYIKIHNMGGSITRRDHSKNHVKTWYCGEGKGSQLGSREHKPKLRKSHVERGTERTEGLRRRFAEARQRNTARPRGTWYGVTTGTHAQHYHVARETGNQARERRGSSIWQREPVVESRRKLREGGWELKCFALDPKRHRTLRDQATRRRSYRIRVRGRCATSQEDGGVHTQDGRRRPVTDWGEEAGETQGEDIRHSQNDESQRVACSITRLNGEHAIEVLPLSSLIGHTPLTRLPQEVSHI